MLPTTAVLTAFLVLGVHTQPKAIEYHNEEIPIMDAVLPSFRFPLSKLILPTLETVCRAIANVTRIMIYDYATNYASILMRHFNCETEVQIVNGALTVGSKTLLVLLESEMEVLQYRHRLNGILGPWKAKLGGQPVNPEIQDLLSDSVEAIIVDFEGFIYKLQAIAVSERRARDNSLCSKACSSSSRILNLSEAKIPAELEKTLANGINFVPLELLNIDELKEYIEKDLVSAAVNFFREENRIYPMVDNAAGLKNILEQLISQSPSNSRQIEFYTTMYNQYVEHKDDFYNHLSEGHFIDKPSVQNLLPAGTILTVSDKGLGPCLLPVDWYIEQYKVQSKKGNHVLINMSADQCINFLKSAIQTFRSELCSEGRSALKTYFANCNPNYRVGVLKLVPKIHKLSTFDSTSWKKLPSRPIRGAENCPINPYSRALCKMLQEMHSSLKIVFSDAGIAFPLIYGCDEYSANIHNVSFDRSVWSLNTLVSADFSDAYTQSNLLDLQASIAKLGPIAGWPQPKIVLAQQLSKLVFENCFFETPSGILRQTKGFPMGGQSSREGLDNILLAGEFDLLSSSVNTNLLYYFRLVDDISVAVNGNFNLVSKLLHGMATIYPGTMPLNVQISFGYSHFLDSHVHNFLQTTKANRFTTSMAYKPLANFEYVPFNSNIAPCYKGKIKFTFF